MTEPVSDIRYMERNDIDSIKWDNCISHAPNGLIYARSFYLDIMSKNWSALVLNDYEAVMPLTWNRKFGISYLYQPAFTAQLGVFFKYEPSKNIVDSFIEKVKSRFRFCEIHLNFASSSMEGLTRVNFVLDLGKPYEEIRKGYKKRLIENLRESEPYQLEYLVSSNYVSTIQLFKDQYGERFSNIREREYLNFEKLCSELNFRNMVFARDVKDNSDELLSTSIFFKDDKRIYNIMSVSLPAGREKRAHFFLLDQLIMEFSTRNILLDFEGSDLAGIAEFYRKFGSVNQPYSFLRYNHLPFPIRLFK
jgi:hypothetical protein